MNSYLDIISKHLESDKIKCNIKKNINFRYNSEISLKMMYIQLECLNFYLSYLICLRKEEILYKLSIWQFRFL